MVLPSPPMPGPVGLPGLDPETVLRLGQRIQEAVEAQVELLTTPVYPRWYDPKHYPRPDEGRMLSRVKQLQAEFAPLRARIQNDLEVARMDLTGTFRDFDPEDDDPWTDAAIAGEIELIASQLADSELAFDAPARKISEEDEAAKKVDFARACLSAAREQHARRGRGSLPVDKARMLLLTGRLAWHCMLNLDPDEDEMPFTERLVDPTSCYPVFEADRGLRIMGRAYMATVAEVIGAYGSEDNDLSYLLESRGRDGKFQRALRETDVREVIEYWDRRWRAVFLDGRLILGPVEHAYGFVPFVYTLSGLGVPADIEEPGEGTAAARGVTYTATYAASDVAKPSKGVSLVTLLKKPHHLREAVLTEMLSAFRTSIDPPLIAEVDDLNYGKGVPEISRRRGDVSMLKMNRQAVNEVPTDPSPVTLGPLLQGLADNQSRLTLPPTAHGQNDKSNVAGYATNMLNEAGLTKTVPHKQALEEFERACMEMRFRMYRDWGHLIRQGEGPQGALVVPRFDAMPGEDQTFDLTPGDLRRTGIRIRVSMSTMPIQMLGPVANAAGLLMQMGVMDEIGVLRLINDPNPHKTLRRIRMNKLLNDPIIQEMEAIEGLMREGLSAHAQYFVARKMSATMGQAMQGGMVPGMDPSASPGGAGPGIPGQSPVGTVVGDSNAAYGQGPGPGSGPGGPGVPPPGVPFPGNEP